jgi:hypothetical protein
MPVVDTIGSAEASDVDLACWQISAWDTVQHGGAEWVEDDAATDSSTGGGRTDSYVLRQLLPSPPGVNPGTITSRAKASINGNSVRLTWNSPDDADTVAREFAYLILGDLSTDTTTPTVNITVNPNTLKISSQSGKDSTSFDFEVDEDVQATQVRIVPGTGSPVTAGTLIESAGALSAGIDRSVTITDDELIAAGGTEGANIIKIFAQDLAGNWST